MGDCEVTSGFGEIGCGDTEDAGVGGIGFDIGCCANGCAADGGV